MSKNQLAVIGSSELALSYPVLTKDSEEARILTENLTGESLGVGDLDRVKVPAAGATSWLIPSVVGEVVSKTIEGVIIHTSIRRAYWKSSDLSNDQPDCSSNDCVTGEGDPGGSCLTCPMAKYGTAIKAGGGAGLGQACNLSRLLFVLQPGVSMPIVVVVPSGSLKSVKQYLSKLPLLYRECITKLELTKATSKEGYPYAKIVPTFVSALEPEARVAVREYSKTLTGIFAAESARHDEVKGDGGEEE